MMQECVPNDGVSMGYKTSFFGLRHWTGVRRLPRGLGQDAGTSTLVHPLLLHDDLSGNGDAG